jgi:hypothetical protein
MTTHLNAIGQELIANNVSTSTCLYFLALGSWGGTKSGVAFPHLDRAIKRKLLVVQ